MHPFDHGIAGVQQVFRPVGATQHRTIITDADDHRPARRSASPAPSGASRQLPLNLADQAKLANIADGA
jgi:hypothetical protein